MTQIIVEYDELKKIVAEALAKRSERPNALVKDYNDAQRALWGLLNPKDQSERVMR